MFSQKFVKMWWLVLWQNKGCRAYQIPLFWPDLHPQIGLGLDLGENYCTYINYHCARTEVHYISDKTNHLPSCSVVYVDYASFHNSWKTCTSYIYSFGDGLTSPSSSDNFLSFCFVFSFRSLFSFNFFLLSFSYCYSIFVVFSVLVEQRYSFSFWFLCKIITLVITHCYCKCDGSLNCYCGV